MGKAPEVNSPTDTIALRFLNVASKSQLIELLDITEYVAERIMDQRTFGGFTKLEDLIEKKLMRKKEFLAFRDALLHATKNEDLPEVDNQLATEDGTNMKNRGAFSEKTLEKAQRPCPRRVDPQRFRGSHF